MSLDNIQLNPKLVEGLYKKSLITLDNLKPFIEEQQITEIPFLGGNNKNILIIVHEVNQKYLSDNNLDFLTNILLACKLTIADTAIINLANNSAILPENIQNTFSPEILIFFGCAPEALSFPINIPQYKKQAYDGKVFLCAQALSVISGDVNIKKQLWACLKNIFVQ